MGGPKLFREHGGRTFLERILTRCRESGSPAILVIDPRFRGDTEILLQRLSQPKPALVEADGDQPMLASLQAALQSPTFAASRGSDAGFWLWPVDAPFLSKAGWSRARDAVHGDPDAVWKLRAGGKTGHPIWFPAWSGAEIGNGTWPNGLLGFLAAHGDRIRILPLEGEWIADFNTPESVAAIPDSL
jgi:CTP:molybdopterin cytidylyltransferase MocA